LKEWYYRLISKKKLTPIEVRDALIECFQEKHAGVVMKQSGSSLEDSKKSIEFLVKDLFSKAGVDFENPTKEGIVAVMDELRIIASNFRDPAVIADSYGCMMELVNKIRARKSESRSIYL